MKIVERGLELPLMWAAGKSTCRIRSRSVSDAQRQLKRGGSEISTPLDSMIRTNLLLSIASRIRPLPLPQFQLDSRSNQRR